MLHKLESTTAPDGTGWKVVGKNNGKLFALFTGVELPVGQWIVDKKTGIIKTDGGSQEYQTGFHIFRTKEAAEALLDAVRPKYHPNAVVVATDYKSVTATGEDSWRGMLKPSSLFQSVVAREIYIQGR